MQRSVCRLVVLILALGCEAGPPDLASLATPSGLKVLIVGIDGATFDVIEPMQRAGGLRELAALMERGAHAPLLSLEHTWSPAVWTTVATGHLPETHGIRWFQSAAGEGETGEARLVSSHDRKTGTLYEGIDGRSRKAT